jgi:signal transduction histidine kinase
MTVLTSLAVMVSQGEAASAVAANARMLHWSNAVLGSSAIARAGNAQAVVFAVDHDLGVAGPAAFTAALAEGRRTLDHLTATVADRPDGANPDPAFEDAAAAFVASAVEVLDLIEEGRVNDAVELSRGGIEQSYRSLELAMTSQLARSESVISETEGRAGQVAGAASALVSMLVPASVLLVYFAIARRQVRERKIALEAELAAERQLSKSKDDFVAALSHELRTPLTSIYGLSAVLLDTGVADADQAIELLTMINHESADLSRMVDDLLAAARVQASALSIALSELPLRREVEAVLESFRRSGKAARVACPPIEVQADRLRLRQVLRNLLSNAFRHGGPNVMLEAHTRGSDVVITVADDGPGIPDHVVERLFEPFVHDERDALVVGSVGLGLAIARSLVEAMGGSLTYVRDAGRSLFSVSLPAAERAACPTTRENGRVRLLRESIRAERPVAGTTR